MKKLSIFLTLFLLVVVSCKKTKDDDEVIVDTSYELIELSTDYGSMYIWLYDSTPLHKSNFIKLAKEGYYDSTTFHRVIQGFMIQGGDPNSKDSDTTNDGTGGPNYTIPAEIRSDIKHKRGVIAAARTSINNPLKASSGSQFYISVSTTGTQHLNGDYTVFGYVMKGMEFADIIVNKPKNKNNNRPFENQYMKIRVIHKTLKQMKDEFDYTPDF